MIRAVILTKSRVKHEENWGISPIAYELTLGRIIRLVSGRNGMPFSLTALNKINLWDIIVAQEISDSLNRNSETICLDADTIAVDGCYEEDHMLLLHRLSLLNSSRSRFMDIPGTEIEPSQKYDHSVEFLKVNNLTIVQVKGKKISERAFFETDGKKFWNYPVRDEQYKLQGKNIYRWSLGEAYVAVVLPSETFRNKHYRYITGIFPTKTSQLPGNVVILGGTSTICKYSASYSGASPDFEIYGIPAVNKEIPVLQHSFVCILRNILSRSSRVFPSEKLAEKFTDAGLTDNPEAQDAVLRFQFVLLLMLEKGILQLSDHQWEFQSADETLLQIAAEDLLSWFKHLYCLAGEEFVQPVVNNLAGWQIEIRQKRSERETGKIYAVPCNPPADKDSWYTVSCGENINYRIEKNVPDKKLASMKYLLRNIFGYESFNDGQLQIIVNILNRRRTIGILPTGGGKSLCYQYASILQPGVSLSVCPLSSLEKDQKDNLDRLGLDRTTLLYSDQPRAGKKLIMEQLSSGMYQMVWISPERFQSQKFRESISGPYTVSYAVIDEVHCLSEWGHDFRPSYLTLIATIEMLFPDATLVGLTATASQAVLKDLKIEFNVDAYGVRALPSLQRENLKMQVISGREGKLRVLNSLLGNKDMVNKDTIGIVFTVFSDKTGDRDAKQNSFHLLDEIQKARPELKSEKFHSRMKDKTGVLDRFKNNEINILSSTKAFGMGINKDDIRYTVHYGLPWSVEAFYQEAGRAGRGSNKLPADCYIIYLPEEESAHSTALKLFERNTTPEEISEILDKNKKTLNDIGNIFFLWKNNNKGVEADLNNLISVHATISQASKLQGTDRPTKCKIQAYGKTDASEKELALYRLKLLGEITDWTIEWKGEEREFTCTLADSFDDAVAKEQLYRYIRRYDPAFADPWTSETKKYRTMLESNVLSPLYSCMKVLLAWSYENIIFSRRRMIYNMKRFCENYTDPDTFRKLIDDFLRISDSGVILDGIINTPKDWPSWFDIFYPTELKNGDNITSFMSGDDCKALHETVARYLESYKNITGLNLIYCLSGALSGRYDIEMDHEIMEAVLADLDVRYFSEKELIINRLEKFLTDHSENMIREQLADITDCIVRANPKKARQYYNTFHNYYSLKIMIETANKRVITAFRRQMQ